MAITSDEVNYLVYRYLQESGECCICFVSQLMHCIAAQSHRQRTGQSAYLLCMASFNTQFTALFFALTDRTPLNLMHCIAAHGYRQNTHKLTAQASRTLRLCSGMKALHTRAPST